MATNRKRTPRSRKPNDLTITETAYISGLAYEDRPADCSRVEWLCLHENMGVKLTPERRAWLDGLRQENCKRIQTGGR
jgi:hypothetical protein